MPAQLHVVVGGSDGAESVCCGAPSVAASVPSTPAHLSPDLRKCLSEVDALLAIHVAVWMKKRGRSLRPKLSDEQRKQLEECFELMDADGSGAIDADELGAAFKLLGLDVSRVEIGEMLAEVDEDGSGEVEYPEFIEIMTSTLAKLAARKESEGTGANQVPFALLATAYRRKRIMEGLISGDREVMTQVTAIAEQAARRAAEEAQLEQQQQQQRHQQLHMQQQQYRPHLGGKSRGCSAPSSPGKSGPGLPSLFSCRVSGSGSITDSAGGGSRGSRRPSGSGSVASAADMAEAFGVERASAVAAQAGVSQGLLRAMQRLTSLKSFRAAAGAGGGSAAAAAAGTPSSASASSCAGRRGRTLSAAAPGSSSSSNSRCGGSLQGGLTALEVVAGMLSGDDREFLARLLRQKSHRRLDALAAATAADTSSNHSNGAGSRMQRSCAGVLGAPSSTSGISQLLSTSGCCAASEQWEAQGDLQALVGCRQHITSRLQLQLLTQTVQAPKFCLSSCSIGRATRCRSVDVGALAGDLKPARPEGRGSSSGAAAAAPGDGSSPWKQGLHFGDTAVYECAPGAAQRSNGASGSGQLVNSRSPTGRSSSYTMPAWPHSRSFGTLSDAVQLGLGSSSSRPLAPAAAARTKPSNADAAGWRSRSPPRGGFVGGGALLRLQGSQPHAVPNSTPAPPLR